MKIRRRRKYVRRIRRKRSLSRRRFYRRRSIMSRRRTFGRRRFRRLSVRKKASKPLWNYFASQPMITGIRNYIGQWYVTTPGTQAMYCDMVVGDFIDIGTINGYDTSFDEVQIKSIKKCFNLKNMDAKPTYVDLYYWTARTDIGDDQGTFMGFIQQLYDNAIGGITGDSSILGVTPHMAPKLGHYMRIWKKRRLFLKPGIERKVYLSQRIPFKAQYSEWLNAGVLAKRSLTKGIITVLNGGVVGDTTDTNDVSTGQAKVNWVCNTKYKYCKARNVGPIFVATTGLDPITTESTINPETDAKQSGDVQA